MPQPPRLISHDGQTLTLAEWAKRTGIPAETIRSRIDKQGWSVADALTVPISDKFNPRQAKPIASPRPCPRLRKHPNGQAYCRWMAHTKEHWRYFGEAGSRSAADGYRRFQMEWAARGAPPPPQGERPFFCELAERYLEHADRYYAITSGAKTMLVGPFKKYKVRDVKKVRVKQLDERYADYDQVGFVAFMRSDGHILNAGTGPIRHLVHP